MKRTSRMFHVWLVLAVACGWAAPGSASTSDAKLDQRLRDAKAVHSELLSSPDRGVPEALRRDCKCVAVVPHVLKGALVYGARHGTGVMSCRGDGG